MCIIIQKLDYYVRYILSMIYSICCAVCIFMIWILQTYNYLIFFSVNDYNIMTIVEMAKNVNTFVQVFGETLSFAITIYLVKCKIFGHHQK